MPRRFALPFVIAAGLLFTGACAYYGANDNPVARNLTWFSYLNGDDIRAECRAGAADRYRFVYNGIYTEQVRSYDVTAGSDPQVRVHVLGTRGNVGTISLASPSAVFAPWAGKTETVPLRPQDLTQLRDAMRAGGVFTPLAGRLELSSDGFYWVVAACRDGAFAFNAYGWPSPRFDAAAFPGLLFAWDPTGIPVNPPRRADPAEIHNAASPSDLRGAQRFNLAAEGQGLIGIGRLF